MLMESFSLAMSNIRASKARTFLTMLGIVIGVAAVTIIVGLGNGLKGYVQDMFADMGTDTLTVTVQSRGSTRSLDADGFYEIFDENSDYLKYCSPTASIMGSVKIGSSTYSSTKVTGVSEDYFNMSGDMDLLEGRGLLFSDIDYRSRVCVVGYYVNAAYFGGSALGQTLKLGGDTYTVIGVLEQTVDTLEEGCTDDCIYVPYTTASRNGGAVSSYTVSVKDEDNITAAQDALEASLLDFFGSDDFYTITSMSEMLDSMNTMINALVLVLAGIAAISLVVGGIGIMNIMLVSVSERTREIGIRKSLGARERYIMEQFVIEAAVTSALGGILGILVGILFSKAITLLINMLSEFEMEVTPTVGSIALAFGISVGIGVLFGYLPAKRAAALNPIDALHHE